MNNQNASRGADGVGSSSPRLTPSKTLDMTIDILERPKRDLNAIQEYFEDAKRFERVWWTEALLAVTFLGTLVAAHHIWPHIVGELEFLNRIIEASE